MTDLTRQLKRNDDEWNELRSRLTGLEALLDERAGEFARTRAALDAFEVRYRHKVGTLHEQLEKLEMAIAEAELGEISKRLHDAGASTQPACLRQARAVAAPDVRRGSQAVS